MEAVIRICRQFYVLVMAVLLFSAAGCAMYTKGLPIKSNLAPRRALVVMDIQNDFVGQDARLPVDRNQADIMIRNGNLLVSAFRSLDSITVYIGNEFRESDRIGNWFRHGAAIKGTPGAEISKRINMPSGIYFAKDYPDAFSNAEFDAFLRKNSVTELVLLGVFADQCVLSTARGGIQRGYSVITVSDGVAAKDGKHLADALKKHLSIGARVVKTSDLLAELKMEKMP